MDAVSMYSTCNPGSSRCLEEGGKAPVVLVGEQALDVGRCRCCSCREEGEEVEQFEHGDEAQVYLAEDIDLVQVSERVWCCSWGCNRGIDAVDLIFCLGVLVGALMMMWCKLRDSADVELILCGSCFLVLCTL